MKKITRSAKTATVEFINVDTINMSMEKVTVEMDYGVTKAQAEKHLKSIGYIPVNVEIKTGKIGLHEMNLDDFLLYADVIDKKSEISGRSITKELSVAWVNCVVAEKTIETDTWEIKERKYPVINDDFDTSDYNSTMSHILEVGEIPAGRKALYGMSERKFFEKATPVK